MYCNSESNAEDASDEAAVRWPSMSSGGGEQENVSNTAGTCGQEYHTCNTQPVGKSSCPCMPTEYDMVQGV